MTLLLITTAHLDPEGVRAAGMLLAIVAPITAIALRRATVRDRRLARSAARRSA